jgi:hypothetical protein
MGSLFYGAMRREIQYDDRALAHLQIVMTAKLRRSERFLLSWTMTPSKGSGRSSVWIHPETDLEFAYSGSRLPEINHVWLDAMTALSNGASGLRVIEERLRPGPADGHHPSGV